MAGVGLVHAATSVAHALAFISRHRPSRLLPLCVQAGGWDFLRFLRHQSLARHAKNAKIIKSAERGHQTHEPRTGMLSQKPPRHSGQGHRLESAFKLQFRVILSPVKRATPVQIASPPEWGVWRAAAWPLAARKRAASCTDCALATPMLRSSKSKPGWCRLRWPSSLAVFAGRQRCALQGALLGAHSDHGGAACCGMAALAIEPDAGAVRPSPGRVLARHLPCLRTSMRTCLPTSMPTTTVSPALRCGVP